MLGRILVDAVDKDCDFVGHIGGDDFVMLLQSEDWEARCQSLLQVFDRAISHFFSAEHIAQQGYQTRDRRGQETLHPLVSLSLGAVPVVHGSFPSHRELSSALAEVKKLAKSQGGNVLVIDRRSGNGAVL